MQAVATVGTMITTRNLHLHSGLVKVSKTYLISVTYVVHGLFSYRYKGHTLSLQLLEPWRSTAFFHSWTRHTWTLFLPPRWPEIPNPIQKGLKSFLKNLWGTVSFVLKSQKSEWPCGGQEERAQLGFYQSVQHNRLLGDFRDLFNYGHLPLKSGCLCRSVVLPATVTEGSHSVSFFLFWICDVIKGSWLLTQWTRR